jgi:enoyl-CoA hydratase/carnithine racemase
MPDGGSTSFLLERIGLARTTQLAMLGERLPSATALDWGLVNAVHPTEELPEAAHQLARRLAEGPTAALAGIKRTVHEAARTALADQLDREATRQQGLAGTADYAEGRAAFGEKRPARFQGR